MEDLQAKMKKLRSGNTTTTTKQPVSSASENKLQDKMNALRGRTQQVVESQPVQATTPVQQAPVVQPVVTQTPTIKSHAGVAQANDRARTIATTQPTINSQNTTKTTNTTNRFDGLTQDEIIKKVNEEIAAKNTISNNADKILSTVDMKEATPYKDALNNLADAEMATGIGLVPGLITKAQANLLPEGVIRNYTSGLSNATGAKAAYKYLSGIVDTYDVFEKAKQGDQAAINALMAANENSDSYLTTASNLIANEGQKNVDLHEQINKGYDDFGSQAANVAGNIVGNTAMLMTGGALGKAAGLAPQTAAAIAGTVSGGLNAAAHTNDPLDISEQAALNGLTSMVFSGVAGGLGKVAPIFKSVGANVLKNAGIGAIASWSSQTANKTLNNIYRLAKDENVTEEEWKNAFFSPEHLFSAIVSAIGYAAQGSIKDSKVVNSETGKYNRAEDLKTLGLNENATENDISKAYRNLVKQYHISGNVAEADRPAWDAITAAKNRLTYNDYIVKNPSVLQRVKNWVNNLGKQTNNATVSDQALVPYSGTNAPTVTNQPIQVAQNTPETISNVPNITNQIANQSTVANNELPKNGLELTNNLENSNKSSLSQNTVYHGTINNVKGQDLKASSRGDLGEGLYFAREKNIAQNFSDAGFRNSLLEPMGGGKYININTGEIITPEKPQIIEANIDNLNIKQLTPREWADEVETYRNKTTNALPPNYETVAQQRYKNEGYDGLEIKGAGMENQIVVFPESIDKIQYSNNENQQITAPSLSKELSTKTSNITNNKEFKQDIEKKFKELTGDSIQLAGNKLAGIELRNNWRKNGNLEGELETNPYSEEAMKLYNKYQNSKKSSNYLYHATGTDRLESIIKNGITTGNRQNQEGVSSNNEIYLSASPELAESYATNDSVTLRIHPKFYDKFENFKNDLLGGEGSYSITNNIPPEMLQIKENGKWINLLDSKQAKQLQNLQSSRESTMLPSNEELTKATTKSIEKEPIVAENKLSTEKSLNDLRSYKKAGDREVNAYQYDNPEVKPFFQYAAKGMLADLGASEKGERLWTWGENIGDGYGAESNYRITDQPRMTAPDIASLLDGDRGYKYSYEDISKGLKAIIEDHGAENKAVAKRIEFYLDKRLRNGYKDFQTGEDIPPDEQYLKFLKGEEYIDPAEYQRQLSDELGKEYYITDKQTEEITKYIQDLYKDNTIDDNFKNNILNRFDNLGTYKEFENIKQEVQDYKDKAYKAISTPKTTEAIKKETKTLNMESTPPQKERKHISTLAHAESIPDEVAKKITSNPRKYYTPQSNQETLSNAKEIIGEDYDRAEYRFLEKELGTAEDVAVADLLIQKAIANGDYNKAAELSVTLAEKLSKSGQVVQAASMIKRLTPDGMLIYAERQLNDFVNTIKKENPTWFNKLVKDGVISQEKGKAKIELTDNEKKTIVENMSKAMDMKDGREKDILVAKTLKIIGDKLPASTLEKVASLRRSGLLMNLKTLNRNLGSDVAFGTLEAIKDIPATVIDKVASMITGQRTTKLPNLKAAAKGFIEEGKYSLQDLYYGIDTTNGEGGKYELPSKAFKRTDSYKDIAKAFKNESVKVGVKKAFNRLLSDYEDAAMFFVNGTDRPFWRARFESELANQMKLGGLKYGEEAPTKEMAEIAKEAADYATFKNKNKLSSTLSGARMFLNNGKPLGLADAIGLTFTNVPGSVGSKIYDYTAGGYIKAIKELYNASRKNGQFNQKKFVDNLGRSLTGTLGIVALAGLIAKGILTGSYDDDKDKADLEREMGIQKNAINFSALDRLLKGEDTAPKKGDVYYNYDWVQPVSGLAVLGTNLYNKATGGTKIENEDEELVSKLDDENEYYVKKKEDANWGDLAMEFLASTANQVVDMSSLGNLSDLFKGYNGLGENLTGAVGSFVSSFIPTISNNIGQYTDETKRNTKDYTSEFKTNINKILNKVPGARETLEPSVNTLGEEKQQYVNGNDFASTFLNPGYYTTYNPSDIQQELMDVYNATGDKTIFPSTSPGSITYQNENVKLKPKGVTTFQKASGQYASGLYDALLDDEFYKSLEPTDKAKVLKMVADDSRDVGKAAIGIQTKNYDNLDTDKYYLEKYDIPLETYYLAEFAMKNYKKNNTDASKRKAIREDSEGNKRFSNLDSEQLEILYKIFDI